MTLQFIDLCILLGCDYCESIKGIGPTRAVALVKQFKSIDGILENIDREKYTVPDAWPYKEARELFAHPHVLPRDDPQLAQIRWEAPDEAELVKFLVVENGFSEKRIRAGIDKLLRAKGAATQGRLDSFFTVLPSDGKRRVADAISGPAAKKAGRKSGGGATKAKAKTKGSK